MIITPKQKDNIAALFIVVTICIVIIFFLVLVLIELSK